MILTHPGHATFLLELANGLRLVTDPVDDGSGYVFPAIPADILTISHSHHDHNCIEKVSGDPIMVDTAGTVTIDPDVRITAIPCYHDEAQGAKRGSNLMMLIETEGLRVAHLGDLGHVPTAEQLAVLGHIDVLMIPVGGFFTIDAAAARRTADLLNARVIVPMHYRTAVNAGWPISPAEDFLSLYPEEEISRQKLLRVTSGDLVCQKHVVVLD